MLQPLSAFGFRPSFGFRISTFGFRVETARPLPRMSDHQNDTAFLRQCLLYEDNTSERHRIEDNLALAQRNENCVRRAVWLMALVTALAIAGLGYTMVFLGDLSDQRAHWIIKAFSALGLAALVSHLTFLGFWMVHRQELNQQREQCRRVTTRLLVTRLGDPSETPLSRAAEGGTASESINETAAPVSASGPPREVPVGARTVANL